MKLSEATVLLVDDEPDLLEVFAAWLENAGCKTVRTACNGEEALAVASESGPPDLLVTDINMPIMDGISLVRN